MQSTSFAATKQTVLAAAQTLIDAFSRHDVSAYFASFAPDASFIFHSTGHVLNNRAEYEQLWREWERDMGFRVMSCASSDQVVQLRGDVAVFHHRVRTSLQTNDGALDMDERETIVFQQQVDGQWLAVHEHLSSTPLL